MASWKTRTIVACPPEHVLGALTDPEACRRWSPVDFELEDLDSERLARGARGRVAGRLVGRRVAFDLEVLESDHRRLSLRARGPLELDVDYEVRPVAGRSEIAARVSVRSGGGLCGRLLTNATDALLAGGALRSALAAVGREVETAAA
jgi:Polyketide cyclase / dehydrase and lipid transport